MSEPTGDYLTLRAPGVEDVLDLPIVNLLDTSFAEHHPLATQPLSRPEGDALVERYRGRPLAGVLLLTDGNAVLDWQITLGKGLARSETARAAMPSPREKSGEMFCSVPVSGMLR